MAEAQPKAYLTPVDLTVISSSRQIHPTLTQNIPTIRSFLTTHRIDSDKLASMHPNEFRDQLVAHSNGKIQAGPANKLYHALKSQIPEQVGQPGGAFDADSSQVGLSSEGQIQIASETEGAALVTGGGSEDEVSRWLSSQVGLAQYATAFQEMGFTTLEVICEIKSISMLQELGIAAPAHETAHRLKLWNAISTLQKQQEPSAPSEEPSAPPHEVIELQEAEPLASSPRTDPKPHPRDSDVQPAAWIQKQWKYDDAQIAGAERYAQKARQQMEENPQGGRCGMRRWGCLRACCFRTGGVDVCVV